MYQSQLVFNDFNPLPSKKGGGEREKMKLNPNCHILHNIMFHQLGDVKLLDLSLLVPVPFSA